jgi:hypothetical protein
MFTREKLLKKLYSKTHKDFKGVIDGVKYVLVYRQGTCSVPLDSLTDKEIYRMLPQDIREQAYPEGLK